MSLGAIRLDSGTGLAATFVPAAGMIGVSLSRNAKEMHATDTSRMIAMRELNALPALIKFFHSNATKGILRPRSTLHTKDPDLLAGREARQCICHVQTNALLAHDHRANVQLCRRFNDRVDRVGEEIFYTLGFENVSNCVYDFHDGKLLWENTADRVRGIMELDCLWERERWLDSETAKTIPLFC